jgi:hypothetical protein
MGKDAVMVIDAKRLTVEEFDEWIHLPENADKRVGGGSRKKNCRRTAAPRVQLTWISIRSLPTVLPNCAVKPLDLVMGRIRVA